MSKNKKNPGARGTDVPVARNPAAAGSSLRNGVSPLWARVFVWCVLGAAGILVLWAIVLTSSQTAEISRFSERGWGQHAPVIVGNQLRALWHAAFMTAVAGLALWWMAGRKGKDRRLHAASVVPMLLVVIVALDAWWLSRYYVKTMPLSVLKANPVIALLKKDMPERRVALVSQDGFYNWWLTYLFPYHGILTVNVTQMPRMPADYKAFLGAVSRNPLRLWQLSAVGYVLAPGQVWQQVRQDPAWSNAFELVYGYNIGPAEAGVSVMPVWDASVAAGVDRGSDRRPVAAKAIPPANVGQHVVLRLTRPAPRFALIGAVREVADADALQLLGSPQYELFREVLVAPVGGGAGEAGRDYRGGAEHTVAAGGDRGEWHRQAGVLTNAGFVGTCTLVNYRSGRMEIAVKADRAGMLRVSEKYDRDWQATVDGLPVPVQRVDYIMQGVVVPAGEHKVLLRYAPALWPLYVQGAGMFVILGAVLWLVVGWVRGRKTEIL